MKIEDEIKQSKFLSPFHKAEVNIIFTAAWLETKIAALLKHYTLTPQQYNILRILRGRHPEPATVNLLRDRMIDKMSNASRIVDKLLLKKLVDRAPGEVDRRQVMVTITEKGLEMLSLIDSEMQARQQAMVQLVPEEYEVLSNLLDKLRD